MPGNGLALTIRVGREQERVGLFQGPGDGIDVLLVAFDDLVIHLETAARVHRAFTGHEVPHVTIGGQHLEVLAQVLLQRFRLGRRFDNNELFAHD